MRVFSSFDRMRMISLMTLVTLLAAVPLACDDSDDDDGDPTGPAPQQVDVAMQDNVFSQAVDTVAVGGTVTWTNTGSNPHTATSDSGVWDSGSVATGGSFSRAFPAAGTFPYHCTFHGAPNGVGMAGTIVVR